ncbi:sigma-54-dependent Fis family transcriptional regulator [Falsiroseomonas bella]|uniref:Sigma-54-dependent Fis family transcriptional regulator n=1 Tax=Falsiroseomonas bella TaxID=2184016 RepID=A0A317FDM3_9PROT|nr:sigma-54 dependent transcriptional regulator [Falsiroseomonas bella]PWS35668.1 sigma-54-dependent Fis family transcriptional regulator [Falsiroseomonas bella]
MGHGILLVEDEATLARNVQRYLERDGFELRIAATMRAGWRDFEEFRPDVVLLDLNLPDGSGLDLLARIRAADRQAKVIILTGHGSVQTAVEAMKSGAWDYLAKPIALGELKLLVDKALGQGRMEETLSYYRGRDARQGGLEAMLGASPAITDLKARIAGLLQAERAMAEGDAPPPVLIRGETGSGKELVARALHYDGRRAEAPFIEVNCATLPAQLVEGELFGHERGAFTDARERRIGLVEAAHGGTLFLDEIGELEPAVQAKLLKVLEDRTVRRLGAVRERRVDVRFVAATHRPLEALVKEGRFRADLYYRLSVVQLVVPPLRERAGDAAMLAAHFLALHGRRYGRPGLRLDAAALDLVARHPWPGNVRELRNAMEQAALAAGEARELGAAHVALAPAPGADLPSPGPTLRQMERDTLVQMLDRTGGNVSQAARLLGISRDTMRYRMAKHGLDAAAGLESA